MKRLFSFLIIGLMSSSILSGAGYLVKKTTENETNWMYLASVIEPRPAASRVLGDENIVSAEDSGMKICVNYGNNDNDDTESIVDYLYTRGEDYSFAHRAQLAANNGITNYVGNIEQNKLLIQKLKGPIIACR